MFSFCFAIEQISVNPLLRVPKCSFAEGFDQGGKLDRIGRASI
jgi:hypothetical protein